jgi:hypothetical protein
LLAEPFFETIEFWNVQPAILLLGPKNRIEFEGDQLRADGRSKVKLNIFEKYKAVEKDPYFCFMENRVSVL